MKKLIAIALLALMLLAGCTAEGGPAEGSPAGAESPVAEASSGDAAGEDRDFARRAYAAQRADGLLAFTAGQEDLVRLTEWVFAGYEEFGPDTAVLLTHEAFPDSLDNNRVWQESGRLEQFLENLAAVRRTASGTGTPASRFRCCSTSWSLTGNPHPALLPGPGAPRRVAFRGDRPAHLGGDRCRRAAPGGGRRDLAGVAPVRV